MFKKIILVSLTAATLGLGMTAMTTEASAQGWGWRHHGWHHRHIRCWVRPKWVHHHRVWVRVCRRW